MLAHTAHEPFEPLQSVGVVPAQLSLVHDQSSQEPFVGPMPFPVMHVLVVEQNPHEGRAVQSVHVAAVAQSSTGASQLDAETVQPDEHRYGMFGPSAVPGAQYSEPAQYPQPAMSVQSPQLMALAHVRRPTHSPRLLQYASPAQVPSPPPQNPPQPSEPHTRPSQSGVHTILHSSVVARHVEPHRPPRVGESVPGMHLPSSAQNPQPVAALHVSHVLRLAHAGTPVRRPQSMQSVPATQTA